MNIFRSSVLSGKGVKTTDSLLGEKTPRGVQSDALDSIPIDREAVRTVDHRDDDRHRLGGEAARVLFRGRSVAVDLINLSGGGAMVRGDFSPLMWERIELVLGGEGSVECAVRWIRGDRFGLEFAHETQIKGDAGRRDAMLLEVVRRSFADVAGPSAAADEPEPLCPPADEDSFPTRRAEPRHPLIWSGTVLHNHDSTPVRLRNISATGALLDSPHPFPEGAELYLDLAEAGSLFATVSWTRGDQVGLLFAQPFDIMDLAKARPELAPQRWTQPDYLREAKGDTSPWAVPWNRMSVEELKTSLEGFLKY